MFSRYVYHISLKNISTYVIDDIKKNHNVCVMVYINDECSSYTPIEQLLRCGIECRVCSSVITDELVYFLNKNNIHLYINLDVAVSHFLLLRANNLIVTKVHENNFQKICTFFEEYFLLHGYFPDFRIDDSCCIEDFIKSCFDIYKSNELLYTTIKKIKYHYIINLLNNMRYYGDTITRSNICDNECRYRCENFCCELNYREREIQSFIKLIDGD